MYIDYSRIASSKLVTDLPYAVGLTCAVASSNFKAISSECLVLAGISGVVAILGYLIRVRDQNS